MRLLARVNVDCAIEKMENVNFDVIQELKHFAKTKLTMLLHIRFLMESLATITARIGSRIRMNEKMSRQS